MTTIKFEAGDKVYWLSSDGFKEGIIKSIIFNDEVTTLKPGKPKRRSKVTYRLWSKDSNEAYQGDEVSEGLIFTSHKDMVDYYVNKGKV